MLLEDETDIDVVGEATDGDHAIELIPDLKPDVLLLDITMPRMSGLEVTRVVSREFPKVRVLIFSMHHNPDYILKSVQNGAAGYLLKDTGEEEILRAVRSVALGELYFPPSASSIIIKQFVSAGSISSLAEPEGMPDMVKPGSVWQKITSREAQILTCLTQGMSNRQIAEQFDISPNTVANQRASIIRKAGVNSSFELVQLAMRDAK